MFVTDTQVLVFLIHALRAAILVFWLVLVNITLVELSAKLAVKDSNRRNGGKTQELAHSSVNVRLTKDFLLWLKILIFFRLTACNCHGHSNKCHYDEDVDLRGESLDIHGNYEVSLF